MDLRVIMDALANVRTSHCILSFAAELRMWQMEFQRRVGQGRLSEVPKYIRNRKEIIPHLEPLSCAATSTAHAP